MKSGTDSIPAPASQANSARTERENSPINSLRSCALSVAFTEEKETGISQNVERGLFEYIVTKRAERMRWLAFRSGYRNVGELEAAIRASRKAIVAFAEEQFSRASARK